MANEGSKRVAPPGVGGGGAFYGRHGVGTQAQGHTPGPWHDSVDCHVRGSREEWSKAFGMTLGEFVASVGGRDAATARANARLIAAAPDLLAACEDALESLARLPDVDGAYRVTCREQLRAAITKARGEGGAA